ncbi:L-fucose isomerase [Caloramator quimbayensis]|uniref:L-fucose isomerase n=1 Tax=Caloramator quimbayensis TaxID=1147123 RepID=A0A1T4XXB3_9CLOT|nr:fucose isomerase [Caloramator quimbayensis]SKA93661.1 L-fucose isomerase [Caloramator quimbayensis]
MKQKIDIGVVCLARKTFDFNAAYDIYQNIKKDLRKIKNVNFHFIDDLVIEVEDAKKAALYLNSKNIDALVVISGTFHLGHLILELTKVIDKPVMLWGLNELPYNGGKIRLNSVCGVNLNASNLYKSGKDDYYTIISDTIDEDFLDAVRIKTALSKAHIGVVGYRAHGFFNLDIDELNTYKKLGILVDHYELSEIYNTQIDEKDVLNRIVQIKNLFDVSSLNDIQIQKVAELCEKIKAFVNKNSITALAVRCWPEFAADFGISPCAAMSILQSEDYILSCEGDLEGAISMLSHRAIGAEYPFLADLSQVDLKEDYALLWHCGVAPCNLWDGKCVRSLDTYFAGGKGVTADFVMKDGELSILRFDSARGKYRLFLQRAKGIPMEKLLKGTYVKVRFEDNINDVLNKVIYNGIAHHVSVVYGDFIRPFEIYAKIMGFEVIK